MRRYGNNFSVRLKKETGEPFVVLHGKGAELLAARGARQLHLSLTHTENYAAATAILEG